MWISPIQLKDPLRVGASPSSFEEVGTVLLADDGLAPTVCFGSDETFAGVGARCVWGFRPETLSLEPALGFLDSLDFLEARRRSKKPGVCDIGAAQRLEIVSTWRFRSDQMRIK